MRYTTIRSKYDWRSFLNKEDFESITELLNKIGFEDIKIKIPINEKTSERGNKGSLKSGEFLAIERNYKGVILIARSIEEKEEIRILFKNHGEANFYDDIFPSVGSINSYNIFVKSIDPLRAETIILTLKRKFKQYKVHSFRWVLIDYQPHVFVCFLFIPIILGISSETFREFMGEGLIYPLSLLGVLIFYMFVHLRKPLTGLFIFESTEIPRIPIWLFELKKQWLVILITSLVSVGATLYFS